MGCSNCTNSKNGLPAGCKNNGNCGVSGCGKLSVFDWLSNMSMPSSQRKFEAVEVRFKNNRKAFYRNLKNLTLTPGDAIVTEGSPGHDVGVVSAVGELARLQINRKQPGYKIHELKRIHRKAQQSDIDRWKEARSMEEETMHQAREMALRHELVMKISDVEYQGDKSKATFYYTAEERVDFRELIKTMADAFKIRIEMKQIGARQEAGRLGGIGSCGRELCCATWLTDFRSVTTSSARYQQLALNPQKLAGQCGKLKCCLNYELDQYIEAFKDFPKPEVKLKTEMGNAVHQKTDIFKRLMWYSYEDPQLGGTHVPLDVDRVREIIALNQKGKKPSDLKAYMSYSVSTNETDYTNVVGQDSLTRFDQAFKKKKKKKRKGPGRKGGGPKGQGNQPQAKAKKQGGQQKKKQTGRRKGGGPKNQKK